MTNPERYATVKEFDKSSATVEDIQRELKIIRDDIARLAEQISALLGSGGNDAIREVKAQIDRFRDKLDDVLADAGTTGLDAIGGLRESTDTLLDSLEDAVRKRPVSTLGIALGVGFLFGVTWRR
jgi:ElaB/YqjD/DUF883 family membrane-anchored ribosome-binding protein